MGMAEKTQEELDRSLSELLASESALSGAEADEAARREVSKQEERRQMHEFTCEVDASGRIVARVVDMNDYQRLTLLAAADALTEVGVQS